MSTIPFLPERLNREPAVFRGLTVSELLIALLAGLAAGAVAGTILAILWRNWSLIPGIALPGATLAILCGGRWLARLKRGRPESWLYRALELRLARFGIGTQRFVLHDGVWAIRRSQR
ncbi:TIGR03750 family conjugal transfer protein [Salmonella enterica]|uniref:Membrane protein n=1 Tax=Salmonella enterica subsp. salamae TaxID=59202 RepID=A0A6D2GD08_SALER|nr:TIGR03750 family conjugal transfer protein [Salmonella enterica]EAA5901499.1 TIGR03750 family conjugal transfer protein [Salmonella enterica subsp. enterica]EDW0467125.1 TIGR03750 family conjugal transfer protein [Salmonella enterica subsp. enterica serovar Victoria]ECF5953125.1 TIGR03750 family conjugal transfer protein [Salmonella enterica subsp. salamae]KAA8685490.1 TIGR03750 family conjugal transfer protein [Salmonella enterica subsp. salamae]VEA06848.1 membrane protein [Salmonella ente